MELHQLLLFFLFSQRSHAFLLTETKTGNVVLWLYLENKGKHVGPNFHSSLKLLAQIVMFCLQMSNLNTDFLFICLYFCICRMHFEASEFQQLQKHRIRYCCKRIYFSGKILEPKSGQCGLNYREQILLLPRISLACLYLSPKCCTVS